MYTQTYFLTNLNDPMHKPEESENDSELYPDFYLTTYWKMICDAKRWLFLASCINFLFTQQLVAAKNNPGLVPAKKSGHIWHRNSMHK